MKRGYKNLKFILLGIFIFIILISIFYTLSSKISLGNKIAIIPIEGIIGVSDSFNSGIMPEDIISNIKDANKDDSIKAIILEINSPGGGVVASEEIANAVKKSKKPVVALIKDVGASGAYWISSSADKIVAYPMSITGSIGVISSYLDFSGLMEKYGVNYNVIKSGEYKDTGSPYKELTFDEKKVLQDIVDQIYYYFIEQISVNRNLSESKVKELATGMVYLGIDAKNNGLVDEIGDRETAIKIAKELANITKADIVTYQKKTTLLDIFNQLSSNMFFYLGRGIGQEFLASNKDVLKFNV
ncbi:MAG: signal peptide peptidase SppA [Nanoarchaeota archaeon]|nr:signal peptide peptidase SppA [Nanoarchaeota archaeon]MBU0962606.1 signal peptide peptidase SppA [Nanoarchaeota archaeon]